ncbi:Ger(x)C family spore germination protein [Ornithinibacillus bavariensis]|uniref:Spore germination protein YfkR n=1 Tax=Ornithinibacillus bavariensis TaxID=545502 RepID=A0A919X4Y1_9BACI|nr:Ger(x)C family spore germination protein [Ornithinibacillus bavariensis]GIO25971.1 putative spore germination protein YfkR [Ornithinibacillus bavariensis]
MKKQINRGKIIIYLIPLFILSGCWDQREVEEFAYVIAMGIDKPKDDENLIKITYLIANPESGNAASGGAGNEPPREVISFKTDDFVVSRNIANTVIAKQISYDLLRILIVSEEFARDENFIRWIYDATKEMEIRRDAKLMITKEDTEKYILNNQPKLETRPHEYFQMIIERGNETGMTPTSDLTTFFRITEADADLFLGIYSTTEKEERSSNPINPDNFKAGEFQYGGETNNTQFAGSAVFKEGKMIDVLTIEETRLTFMLNPTLTAQEILTTFPDPFDEKYRIATRLTKNGTEDIKINTKKSTPSIDVNVPILVEVLTNHSMEHYAKDSQKRKTLNKSFEQALEKKLNELIRKTQEEYKADPFGWSLIARKKFLTIPEWEAFDWMKKYPEMDINITVDVELGKFGRQGDIPKLKEIRD